MTLREKRKNRRKNGNSKQRRSRGCQPHFDSNALVDVHLSVSFRSKATSSEDRYKFTNRTMLISPFLHPIDSIHQFNYYAINPGDPGVVDFHLCRASTRSRRLPHLWASFQHLRLRWQCTQHPTPRTTLNCLRLPPMTGSCRQLGAEAGQNFGSSLRAWGLISQWFVDHE